MPFTKWCWLLFNVLGFPEWLQIDCLMVLSHFSQRSISWWSLITRVILCFSPSYFKDRHICPFLVFRDFLVLHHYSKIMTCGLVATSACTESTPRAHIIKFCWSEYFKNYWIRKTNGNEPNGFPPFINCFSLITSSFLKISLWLNFL